MYLDTYLQSKIDNGEGNTVVRCGVLYGSIKNLHEVIKVKNPDILDCHVEVIGDTTSGYAIKILIEDNEKDPVLWFNPDMTDLKIDFTFYDDYRKYLDKA